MEIAVRKMVRRYGTKYYDSEGLITTIAIDDIHFSIIDHPGNSGIQVFIPVGPELIYGTFSSGKPDNERLRTEILPMVDRYMVLDDLANI